MRRHFEDLATAPRPRVLGDEGRAIDQPDDAVVGEQSEHPRRVVTRDRVAIRIEANERLRVDLDRLDACGLGERLGEWQEPCALVGEHIADGALRDGRVRSDVRDLGDEPREQAITLVDAGDGATREEAVA